MLLSISKSRPQLDKNNALILLVDDNSEYLRLLSKMLESQGFAVKKTVNARKAIDIARKQIPDVIILDINIPDINGYPVYQHLKCQEETVNIPIIFMGTTEQITDKVNNFDIARVDCITKPFQEEEVLTQVRNKLAIYHQEQEIIDYSQLLEKQSNEHLQLTNALVSVNHNLQPVALFDTVTKVANRKKFDEYLNAQWQKLDKKQLPLSLLLCNFDFSQHINNVKKDQILQQLATAIKSVVKRSTDLVARYEHQKFAIILPCTDSKGAVYVGKLIREQVDKIKLDNPQFVGDKGFNLSIGVATIVPSDKMTPQSLIDLVEQAIHKAKVSGKT